MIMIWRLKPSARAYVCAIIFAAFLPVFAKPLMTDLSLGVFSEMLCVVKVYCSAVAGGLIVTL